MNVIEQKRASGDLVMGKHFSDGTRWTTKEHLDLEHSIIEKIKDGKDKISPLLDSKTIASLLDKVSSKNNLNLTLDQKNACNLITTTKDRFIMIQGYAGTGKTTLFKTVRDVLNERVEVNKHEMVANSKGDMAANSRVGAITILALAPTHRAVNEH
jgi:Holliday junction resolvasome RuvABC ATP-dependent DNA helicase subunit